MVCPCSLFLPAKPFKRIRVYICSTCMVFLYFCPQSEQLWLFKGKETKQSSWQARKAFFTFIHSKKLDCFVIICSCSVTVSYAALHTRLVVLGTGQTVAFCFSFNLGTEKASLSKSLWWQFGPWKWALLQKHPTWKSSSLLFTMLGSAPYHQTSLQPCGEQTENSK